MGLNITIKFRKAAYILNCSYIQQDATAAVFTLFRISAEKEKKAQVTHILMPDICIGLACAYTWHLHMLSIYKCSLMTYTTHMWEYFLTNSPYEEKTMRTVSIFKNGNNRAIRLPRDLDFEGVSELEIVREGDSIILRPVRPTWGSFAQLEKADPDFMAEREDVVSDEGRFYL